MLAVVKDTREFKILDRVRAQRSASVAELADLAGASIPTIRRDLQRLDGAGLLRRTHGGAVAVENDAPFAEVESQNSEAKRRIARFAAATVQDGESVLLDIGTTVVQLARELRGRPVTVVTTSLKAFEALRDDRAVHLILLPGDYDPVYHGVSGHLTTECLRLVQADRVFLGVSGLADNGDLRDTTISQIPIKRAMAEASGRVTVLADASKFPGRGAGRLPAAGLVDSVITDQTPPAVTAAAYLALGVRMELV